jgi:hypothetical protein
VMRFADESFGNSQTKPVDLQVLVVKSSFEDALLQRRAQLLPEGDQADQLPHIRALVLTARLHQQTLPKEQRLRNKTQSCAASFKKRAISNRAKASSGRSLLRIAGDASTSSAAIPKQDL